MHPASLFPQLHIHQIIKHQREDEKSEINRDFYFCFIKSINETQSNFQTILFLDEVHPN